MNRGNCMSENKNWKLMTKRLEKQIKDSRIYTDSSESMNEAFMLGKNNAQIVLMNLKTAKRENETGKARRCIWQWAETLCADGRYPVSEKSLFGSLRDFDQQHFIRSTEYFCLKNIIVYYAAEIFCECFDISASIEKARMNAEKWIMDTKANSIISDNIYFLEYALKLSYDLQDSQKRERLIKQLDYIGKNEDEIIEIAAKGISETVNRITNAAGLIHLVNHIDWAEEFTSVSQIERILLSDPGKVYPEMDDESKNYIRSSLETISTQSGFTENTIVSLACELTRKGEFNNICQSLYTDNGRSRLLRELNPSINYKGRMYQDSEGKRIVFFHILGMLVLTIVSFSIFSPVAAFFTLPLLWAVLSDAFRFIALKMTKPHPLLSLHFDNVPEESRTLVTIPALLANEVSAEKICMRLWEHGVHEEDANIDFLLLGDFKDSANEEETNDSKITDIVRAKMEEMNGQAGRKKFLYLQRNRTKNESDRIWMGRERKRGAIEDLNRLILTGRNHFSSISEDAEYIKGRYKYILTVDSDTRLLPGEIRKLIGMISHPLNQKYGLIQPRMETLPPFQKNLFFSMFSGVSGGDQYDICAGDFYQDLTGEGLFSGKGIYNIKKFHESTSGVFEENTILSHDMIEGILVKAAYAGNRVMFESFPESLEGYLKRLDRWTRGDWQLIYYLFGKIKLSAISRFKIISNVFRSLKSLSVLLGLAAGLWHSDMVLISLSLFAHFLPVLLHGKNALLPALSGFMLLPSVAYTETKAWITALIRIFITKRKRLEWVTAAENIRLSKGMDYPGIIASLMLIPGLFSLKTFIFALTIGLVFAFGRTALKLMQRISCDDSISSADYAYLSDLARSIWKYFEKYVPLTGNGLPPDNVQLDPAIGVQKRTSPTNIGMYILSAIGAEILGLIDKSELHERLRLSYRSLDKMETYKGLYYNWYDCETLLPVYPRYLSSVDLGNLMAAFITARNYLKEENPSLSGQFQGLIEKTDISFLYNKKRDLFRIGYDVDNQRMSASHYDLLASEARILSYVSMAEKGIPVKHWKRLGRPFSCLMNKPVVLSWSGTMFEYLMPGLLMPHGNGSLMKNTEQQIVDIQSKHRTGAIWGISESGYAALDQNLNYQYRAFGISDLSLSGECSERVFSPYSAFLSLEIGRNKSIQCLSSMQEAGLRGEYGFYEAIDMRKPESAEIIYSYMTHHQGMSFVSLVNMLTGNKIKDIFLSDPKESALVPLLSEKPIATSLWRIERFFEKKEDRNSPGNIRFQKSKDYVRYANLSRYEGHILFSKNACAYFEPGGRSFYRKDGYYANLWTGDDRKLSESLLPKIIDAGGEAWIKRSLFDTGNAVFELEGKEVKAKICFTINPENGYLLIKSQIVSVVPYDLNTEIISDFRISLTGEDSMHAHPVFSDLFVRETKADPYGKIYARKNRETLNDEVFLIHSSDRECTNDLKEEPTHSKHSKLRRIIRLSPFEVKEVYFAIGIEKNSADSIPIIKRSIFERSEILLRAQMNAHIHFCGLNALEYKTIDRMTVNLFSFHEKEGRETIDPKSLWPLGISGDTPVIVSIVRQKSSLAQLKKAVRIHEFYRYASIHLPLIILHVKETDYFTPIKDAIDDILSASHLNGLKNRHGGVFVFALEDIHENQKRALYALSVVCIKNDFYKDAISEKRKEIFVRTNESPLISEMPENIKLYEDNGYGEFLSDEPGYLIRISPQCIPPRRWSNFLANEHFGAMTNDLGIAHLYYKNSRTGRITPFENDLDLPMNAIEIYISENGKIVSLTPGRRPMRRYDVIVKGGESIYRTETEQTKYEMICFVDPDRPHFHARIHAEKKTEGEIKIKCFATVRFLLGTDARDLRFTRIDEKEAITIAHGKCGFSVFSGFLNPTQQSAGMETTIVTDAQGRGSADFILGVVRNEIEGEDNKEKLSPDHILMKVRAYISDAFGKITVKTGSTLRDQMANHFMKAQTLYSRFYARFGPYQPGGAYGMRDQMQDLLSIMYFDKAMSRNHLLLCASKQFEKGDGLHWWHMPSNGVRTRISDDILFLAYVTAKYINISGDKEILSVCVPFLKGAEVPQEQDDLYSDFEETTFCAPLYDHIMRAFRYVNKRGRHDLLLMGSGDWNDGMNRVGNKGAGESVWLSEFFICASKEFMPYAKTDDRDYLIREGKSLKHAIETHAWDGGWYIRAFDDNGNRIGSKNSNECRIDLITQTWAVFAGLDRERAKTAIKNTEEELVDQDTGLIRLLTPAFKGSDYNPGYISAYPEGIRENGGQYTHAACWLVKAYATLGLEEKAWEAFDMLLPLGRTDSKEKTKHYGGEPYVLAADVSANPKNPGVCGWTWYTGAAAWAERVLLEDLLGFDIKDRLVRICALHPKGIDSVKVEIRFGNSVYRLISKKNSKAQNNYVEMIDDGKTHEIEMKARI